MEGTLHFNGVRIKTPPKFAVSANGQEYCQFITCFQKKSIMVFFFDDERPNSPYKKFKEDLQRANKLDSMTQKQALSELEDFRTNAADALFVGETKINLDFELSVYDASKYLKENKERLEFRYKVTHYDYADTYGARQALLSIRVKENNTGGEKRIIDVPNNSNALSAFGI